MNLFFIFQNFIKIPKSQSKKNKKKRNFASKTKKNATCIESFSSISDYFVFTITRNDSTGEIEIK